MPRSEPWWAFANAGVIGLGPGPWTLTEYDAWPREGYDAAISKCDWDAGGPFAVSGHTKAEWLELGDEMIRRWTEWRVLIASQPDEIPAIIPTDFGQNAVTL